MHQREFAPNEVRVDGCLLYSSQIGKTNQTC